MLKSSQPFFIYGTEEKEININFADYGIFNLIVSANVFKKCNFCCNCKTICFKNIVSNIYFRKINKNLPLKVCVTEIKTHKKYCFLLLSNFENKHLNNLNVGEYKIEYYYNLKQIKKLLIKSHEKTGTLKISPNFIF